MIEAETKFKKYLHEYWNCQGIVGNRPVVGKWDYR